MSLEVTKVLREVEKAERQLAEIRSAMTEPVHLPYALEAARSAQEHLTVLISSLAYNLGHSQAVEQQSKPATTLLPTPPGIQLDATGEQMFHTLRSWRLDRARKDGISPYLVAYDRSLRQVAKDHPMTLEKLSGIQGFGPVKATKYGVDILDIVRCFTVHQGGCPGDCTRMPDGRLGCAAPSLDT
jgi:superfamily II DNA helicase RecQ